VGVTFLSRSKNAAFISRLWTQLPSDQFGEMQVADLLGHHRMDRRPLFGTQTGYSGYGLIEVLGDALWRHRLPRGPLDLGREWSRAEMA
jgi:hypothetical protein